MPNKNKRKGNCFLCGKHNCALCQHCSDVHTCKLHFLSHRQNDYCFPFKIGDDQNSLVASRDIQPLELILFERPLALGPKYYDTTQKQCVECLKNVKNEICNLCGLSICSDQCQMGHNHYVECQVLSHVKNQGTSAKIKQKSVLPIRILAGCDLQETAYNKAKLFHQNLSSESLDESVESFIKGSTTASINDIQWAVQMARRKTVETSNGQGSVFYPIFSLVSHVCSPNAKFLVYPNHCMAMQAQRLIKRGEEICVSYVPTLEPTWKRRAMLYRNRMEKCFCARCKDPTEFNSNLSALHCQKCSSIPSSPILPTNPLDANALWNCQIHCRMQIPAHEAQQLAIDLQLDLYAGGLITTIKKLESKIANLSLFLHPHHGLLLAAKRSLLNCYTQVSPSESAGRPQQVKMKEICEEQILACDKVDSGYADWKGDIYKHLSTAMLNLARLDLQENKIERPEFLLRVKEAMRLVQEGIRCKSCVKVARSTMSLEEMVDSLSESEMSSRNSSVHNSLLDLR